MSTITTENGLVRWVDERGELLFLGSEKAYADLQNASKESARAIAAYIDAQVLASLK